MYIGTRPGLVGIYHLWWRAEERKEDKGKLGEMSSMRIFAFLTSFWIWQRIGINGERYYVVPIGNKSNPSKGKSDFKCMMIIYHIRFQLSPVPLLYTCTCDKLLWKHECWNTVCTMRKYNSVALLVIVCNRNCTFSSAALASNCQSGRTVLCISCRISCHIYPPCTWKGRSRHTILHNQIYFIR